MVGSLSSFAVRPKADTPPDNAAEIAAAQKREVDIQFDEEMAKLAKNEAEKLGGHTLSADEYFAKKEELEKSTIKELLDDIKKHEGDNKYTQGQQAFVKGMDQNHKFHDRAGDAAAEFAKAPKNDTAQNKYAGELAKRETLAKAMAASPEFADTKPILEKIAQLEHETIEAVKNGEVKRAQDLQRQVSDQSYKLDEYSRAHPEKAKENLTKFVDKNMKNEAVPDTELGKLQAILKESGAQNYVNGQRGIDQDQREKKGKAKTAEAKEKAHSSANNEIGSTPQTPAGPARGSVPRDLGGERGGEVAKPEVGGHHDTGKGAVKPPPSLEAKDMRSKAPPSEKPVLNALAQATAPVKSPSAGK